MDNQDKSWNKVFSGPRNQLDSIIGKVPIKSIFATLAAILLFIGSLLFIGLKIEVSCNQTADLTITSVESKYFLGNIRITDNQLPILNTSDIVIKLDMIALPVKARLNLESVQQYGGYSYIPVSLEKESSNVQQVLDPLINKSMPTKIIQSCHENMLEKLFSKLFEALK